MYVESGMLQENQREIHLLFLILFYLKKRTVCMHVKNNVVTSLLKNIDNDTSNLDGLIFDQTKCYLCSNW